VKRRTVRRSLLLETPCVHNLDMSGWHRRINIIVRPVCELMLETRFVCPVCPVNTSTIDTTRWFAGADCQSLSRVIAAEANFGRGHTMLQDRFCVPTHHRDYDAWFDDLRVPQLVRIARGRRRALSLPPIRGVSGRSKSCGPASPASRPRMSLQRRTSGSCEGPQTEAIGSCLVVLVVGLV